MKNWLCTEEGTRTPTPEGTRTWNVHVYQFRHFGMVPEAGLEPAHCCQYWILNPARLPIPPLRPPIKIMQKIGISCFARLFSSAVRKCRKVFFYAQ